MVRFLKRLLLFLALLFIIANIISHVIINTRSGISLFNLTTPFISIHKSKNIKVESDIVVIGGSVCNQLYPIDKHKNSVTTWGTALMPGYYMLAENVLKNNDSLSTVLLLETPMGIYREFYHTATYGSLVRPFFTFDKCTSFSGLLRHHMSHQPLSFLGIFPLFKVGRFFPELDLSKGRPFDLDNIILSDISIEYLLKLKKLCDDNNVTLVLRSPPINKQRFREKTENFKRLKLQIEALEMEHIFDGYFESITYADSSNYRDYAHFKNDIIRNRRQTLLAQSLDGPIYDMVTNKVKPISYNGPKVTLSLKETIKGSLDNSSSDFLLDIWIYFDPQGPFNLTTKTPRMPAVIGGIGFYEHSKNELRVYTKDGEHINDVRLPLRKGWHKITIETINGASKLFVNSKLFTSFDYPVNFRSDNYLLGTGYSKRFWAGELGEVNLYKLSQAGDKELLKQLNTKIVR